MALQLLESLDVYYGQNKRKVSLFLGDASALTAQEAVDYLAVSTLPDYYLADVGTLLYSLNQKGVSVAELAKHKQQDFRPGIPCWISQKITGINVDRLIIFEPEDARNKAMDLVTYIFSAITAQEKGRTNAGRRNCVSSFRSLNIIMNIWKACFPAKPTVFMSNKFLMI